MGEGSGCTEPKSASALKLDSPEGRGTGVCSGEHAAVLVIDNFHDRRKLSYQIPVIVHGHISAGSIDLYPRKLLQRVIAPGVLQVGVS